MDSSESDMCVPKIGEELIYIQQRHLFEIEDLICEYNKLCNLIDSQGQLCDINDADWVIGEKSSLIEKITEMPKHLTTMPPTKPEGFLTLLDQVKTDHKLQLETLKTLEDQIENLETKLNDAQVLLLIQKNTPIEESPPQNTVDDEDAQTKKDFHIYKKYLHGILELHFNNINLKKLVQDLTVAYFKEDDKYLDITEGYSFTAIEVLKQASLITYHPNDNMKISFCDLF